MEFTKYAMESGKTNGYCTIPNVCNLHLQRFCSYLLNLRSTNEMSVA